MSFTADRAGALPGMEEHVADLLALRRSLLAAHASAPSPAVARALEMADTYLFLGLSTLGYSDALYPEEAFPDRA